MNESSDNPGLSTLQCASRLPKPTFLESLGQWLTAARGLRRIQRWLIYSLSLVLLVACMTIAFQRAPWATLAHIDALPFAGLTIVIALSLAINALLFQMATRPFEQPGKRIGVWDWQAMMAATALVNYMPKAGLVGRTALLKHRWGIKYRTTIFILAAITTATVVIMAGLLALTLWRHGFDGVWAAVMASALPLAALVCVPFVTASFQRFGGHPHQRTLGLWLLVWFIGRLADTMCTIARLYLAAMVLDVHLSIEKASVLALAAMFITMALPIPNGLGVREWLYGFLGEMSIGGVSTIHSLSTGLGIGMIDRAAEAIVFIILGLLGLAYLHRQGLSLIRLPRWGSTNYLIVRNLFTVIRYALTRLAVDRRSRRVRRPTT